MNCVRTILLALLLPISLALASQSRDGERILSYGSTISVSEDATVTVKEVIQVRSQGVAIKRGIYRDFPTRYKDYSGHNYVVGFTVLEVMRDGSTEAFHTEQVSNGVRVYVGSSDVRLSPGVYTYTILYRTTRQVGFFAGFDELYWNVTGNGWAFPIDRATAIVSLPAGANASVRTAEAYTGPEGAQEKDYTSGRDALGNVTFATTQPLAPSHGLTIVVSWPKGFVQPPTEMEEVGAFLDDNIATLLSAAGLLVVLLYYVIVWARVGVDPQGGTIIPRFEPPWKLSPAAVRYISRMGYDNNVFAATVINLAVHGYLRISDEGGTHVLTRVGTDLDKLAPYERTVATTLFSGRERLVLKSENHRIMSDAIKALKASLKRNYETVYFITNIRSFIPGLVLSAVVFVLPLFWLTSPPEAIFATVWLSIWSVAVAALFVRVVTAWRPILAGGERKFGAIGGAVGITLFATPFVLGEFVGVYFLWASTSATVIFSAGVLAFINYLYYRLLKAPTRAGRKLLDGIEGFKMYLSIAEKERLNILNPPEQTPELFERYLPYALALGVEQKWSEQFSDVLARAKLGGREYSPVWYAGSAFTAANLAGFTTSVGSTLSSAISSSSVAPGSSSGGGGGGSSGGGGGGGGGGGW